MDQMTLLLPEPTSLWMEQQLAQTCTVHVSTTLDGNACRLCELDDIHNRLYELEREDGTRTETYIRLEERTTSLGG